MNLESIIAPAREREQELLNLIEDQEQEKRRFIEEVEQRKIPLKEELTSIRRILRAADPATKPGRKPGPVAGNRAKGANNASRNVRYGVITAAVLDEVLKMEKDDQFRGTDIRNIMPEQVNGVKVSSSNVAEAFNALREDGMIRFVRKDGNSRFYAPTGEEPSPDLLARLGRS